MADIKTSDKRRSKRPKDFLIKSRVLTFCFSNLWILQINCDQRHLTSADITLFSIRTSTKKKKNGVAEGTPQQGHA